MLAISRDVGRFLPSTVFGKGKKGQESLFGQVVRSRGSPTVPDPFRVVDPFRLKAASSFSTPNFFSRLLTAKCRLRENAIPSFRHILRTCPQRSPETPAYNAPAPDALMRLSTTFPSRKAKLPG